MASVPQHVHLGRGGYEDLDAVMVVMHRAFDAHYGEAWTRSQCAGILPMMGVSLVLARDGDMLVGFSLHRTVADEAELMLLAVDPTVQGRGIGRMLLEAFAGDCKRRGARRLHLEVREGNPATRFYEAAGYALAGRRQRYYCGDDGHRIDALTYVKNV